MSDSAMKSTAGKGESKNLLIIAGEKAKIKGKIDIDEAIDINCEIEGEIKANGKLTIQKNGHVKAEVNTKDAVISGKFEGNMKVNGKIEVTKNGTLKGNITTDRIVINDGGIFSGTVKRISEEKNLKLVKSAPKAKMKKVVRKNNKEKRVVKKKEKVEVEKIGDFNFDYGQKV